MDPCGIAAFVYSRKNVVVNSFPSAPSFPTSKECRETGCWDLWAYGLGL